MLKHFYGTAVMNVITSDFAHCLFPRRTLIKRENQIMISGDLTDSEDAGVSKYEQRGWLCVPWNMMEMDQEIASAREVGDRYTWTVRLFSDDDNHVKRKRIGGRCELRFAVNTCGVTVLKHW